MLQEKYQQPAGGIPEGTLKNDAQYLQFQMSRRTYQPADEYDRSIHKRDCLGKIDQPFKRVVDQNLWNEKFRLTNKFMKFHKDQNAFRKSPRNLELVKFQEKAQQFKQQSTALTQTRQQSHVRYQARQLERNLIQHKSQQPVSPEKVSEIHMLHQHEPQLVDELLLKKKWKNAQKDPQRALNDQFIQTTDYWQSLNNLPAKMVGNIVTPSVLNKDKNTCDELLKKIMEEKKSEENKKEIQQIERAQLRENLKTRHNKTQQLERNCGVRLGMKQELGKELNMKFTQQKFYPSNEHLTILAMPKPEYQGKDFFQRSDFRGLLLADYQEAIGDRALNAVEDLNRQTVSQFGQLKSFKDSLNQKKTVENFYKTGLKTHFDKQNASQNENQTTRIQIQNFGDIKGMKNTSREDSTKPTSGRVFNMEKVSYETLPSNGNFWMNDRPRRLMTMEDEGRHTIDQIARFEQQQESEPTFKYPRMEYLRQMQKSNQVESKEDKYIRK